MLAHRTGLALLAFLAAAAVPSNARLAAVAPAAACAKAATQAALNACTAAQAKAADARVAAAYARVLASATGSRRPLVVAAQKAWSAYRDAECTATAAVFAGGSMQPMQLSVCRTRIDQARSAELRSDVSPGTQ